MRRFHKITHKEAIIIAEIRNPHSTTDPSHLTYHELNRKRGRTPGQLRIRIKYKRYVTPWFDYLCVSLDEMRNTLKETGWKIKSLLDSNGPLYIAIIEEDCSYEWILYKHRMTSAEIWVSQHDGGRVYMTDQEKVRGYYDEGAQDEYLRLRKSPLYEAEYRLTIDLMDEYVGEGSLVLDVGAGPGRYSEYLIKRKKCRVGLVDISEISLKLFADRIESRYKDNILFVRRASAINLDFVADNYFDSVLVMGPLYHLKKETERRLALRECRRVLKNGGYVFASFVSPYPLLPRILERDPGLLGNDNLLNKLINQGIVKSDKLSNWVEQFRCWPSKAKQVMEEEGFETMRLRSLEGIGTFFQKQQEKVLTNEADKNNWFNVLRKTCENPDLLGATIHFLYVGMK